MLTFPASRPCDAAELPVQFKIASSKHELYQAFGLVYESYLESGLAVPNPYQMRITSYHLLPDTEVLVADEEGEIVCTATIVRDGPRGLPMDAVYADAVRPLRQQGWELAEVSCLADRRKHMTRAFPVVSRLMSLIAQVAKQRGVDQLLAAVHPRHGRFYERYFGFTQFGDETSYPSVRNRPAVALALNLNTLAEHSPQGYERLFGEAFPRRALRPVEIPDHVLAEMRRIAAATSSGASIEPTSGRVPAMIAS